MSHSLWLVALFVLVVNDHLFKGSALPSWLTGKMSDVAGPIVAAALLAVLVGVRSPRGWLQAHVATALGFAAINILPVVARAVETLSASMPMPWLITVDPTDLLGLLALPLSYVVLGRAAVRSHKGDLAVRKRFERMAIPVAAVACMATSAQPPDPVDPEFPTELGALSLANETGEDRLVRVSTLKPTVGIDCDSMLADPSYALSRDLFAPATTWFLESGRALPLANTGINCSIFLIETAGLPSTLLAWAHSRFPDTRVPTAADSSDPRVASLQQVGDDFLLVSHETAAYLREPAPAPRACQIESMSTGVDWSTSPNGTREITAIESAPNGCHEISFQVGIDLVLCAPVELPFQVGESVLVAMSTLAEGGRFSDNIELRGSRVSMQVSRGSVLPEGFFRVESIATCNLQHDECGNSVRASQLWLDESGEIFASAGDTMTLDNGDELHLLRVQQMPARDQECAPAADGLDYLEYVLLRNIGDSL